MARRALTTASARLLVGRTIVGFELRSWRDDDPERTAHHDPVLVLDNGARVSFTVTETYQGASYGVRPNYHPKERKP